MMETCSPSVRLLYAWEIEEARLVFSAQLNYLLVRVHECHLWLKRLHRLGCWLKGVPSSEIPNAITLGYHCYFPVVLANENREPSLEDLAHVAWLIHELTHVWQYQRLGWRYLILALYAQFRYKEGAYDFGGEEGLRNSFENGMSLNHFNLEQQGEITRTYYMRLKTGREVSAWLPFIEEIQRGRGI